MSFIQRIQERSFSDFEKEGETWDRVIGRIEARATQTSRDPLDILLEAEQESEETGYDIHYCINRKIEEITHG